MYFFIYWYLLYTIHYMSARWISWSHIWYIYLLISSIIQGLGSIVFAIEIDGSHLNAPMKQVFSYNIFHNSIIWENSLQPRIFCDLINCHYNFIYPDISSYFFIFFIFAYISSHFFIVFIFLNISIF